MNLNNKNIILAICGSIAAYKSPDIVRRLQELGANVKVVITLSGEKFITKLSLETVSKNPVYSNLWSGKMEHIGLAKWADIILITPITANTIANIANGYATDLLGNIVLATTAKIIIVPVMNKVMLDNSATKTNLETLKSRGVHIIDSDFGSQACGDIGIGRMPEPLVIAEFVAKIFYSKLAGKNIVITLGGTIEKIDPVRYISNFSSGKMGVALGNACLNLGCNVVLIYANISTILPQKSQNIQALSADEMLIAVTKQMHQNMDIFISCAAVSDYKIANISSEKTKKTKDTLTLELVKNVDILSKIASKNNKLFCVGFAAETNDLEKYAIEKLRDKNLDIIVANYVKDGFDGNDNSVIIINKTQQIKLTKVSKNIIAEKIMLVVEKNYISSNDKT